MQVLLGQYLPDPWWEINRAAQSQPSEVPPGTENLFLLLLFLILIFVLAIRLQSERRAEHDAELERLALRFSHRRQP